MEHDQQERVTEKPKRQKGFAMMDPDKRRAVARKGGQVAHELGRAHEFTHEEAQEAGKKGGFIVSRNSEHMSSIGRLRHAAARIRKDQADG